MKFNKIFSRFLRCRVIIFPLLALLINSAYSRTVKIRRDTDLSLLGGFSQDDDSKRGTQKPTSGKYCVNLVFLSSISLEYKLKHGC